MLPRLTKISPLVRLIHTLLEHAETAIDMNVREVPCSDFMFRDSKAEKVRTSCNNVRRTSSWQLKPREVFNIGFDSTNLC